MSAMEERACAARKSVCRTGLIVEECSQSQQKHRLVFDNQHGRSSVEALFSYTTEGLHSVRVVL